MVQAEDSSRGSGPQDARGTSTDGASPAADAAPPVEHSRRLGGLVPLGTCAGLLAGLVAWLAGEATLNTFRPPTVRTVMMGQVIDRAEFGDQVVADSRNATVAFAVLGGVLGLTLGVAGGLARRDGAAAARAGGLGAVLGVLLGSGASIALLPLYFRALDLSPEALSQDMLLPFLVHGGIWAACGLAGGAALGLGLGAGRSGVVNAALGGLLGALLGTLVYEAAGGLLFTARGATSPLSWPWPTRLMARLLVATLAGLVAAALVERPGRRAPATPTAA